MALYKYDKVSEVAQSQSTSTGGGGGSVGGNYLPASKTEDGYQVSEDTQFVKQLSLVTEDGTKVAVFKIDANGNIYTEANIVTAGDVVARGLDGQMIPTIQEWVDEYLAEHGAGGGIASIELSLNQSDYKLQAIVTNLDGDTITSNVIDFPIESVVVGGDYDATNKNIVLTLKNGGQVTFSVADLVSGLASTAYVDNAVGGITKASLGLGNVDDTSDANKPISTATRTALNGKLSLSGGQMTGDIKTDLDTCWFRVYNSDKSGGLYNYGIGWTRNSAGRQILHLRNYFGIVIHTDKTNGGNVSVESDLDVIGRGTFTTSEYDSVVINRTNANGGAFVRYNPANQKTDFFYAGALYNKTEFAIYYDTTGVDRKVLGVDNNGNLTIAGPSTTYMHLVGKYGSIDMSAYVQVYNNSLIFQYGSKYVSIDGNGSLVAQGDITAYSDARLKSDIKDLEYRGSLTPKCYIKDGKRCIGFIAQEVRKLYPELVQGVEKEDEYLSLNYGAITAVLAAENKELRKKVESLEERIAKLEALLVKGGEA